MNYNEALNRLKEGNKRFTESNFFMTHKVEEKRLELTKGQNPFAVIISCSDSRVPSEIVFDAGLGDLFVIRNAGNIISSSVIGSVEYALSELGVKLVLILGHDDCGAINKTVNNETNSFFLREIIEKILPAVEEAKKQEGDLHYNAAVNNIKNQVNILKNAGKIISSLVEKGEVLVTGGCYCINCGKIDFFDI